MNLLSKKIVSVLCEIGTPVQAGALFVNSDLVEVLTDTRVSWSECFCELLDSGVVTIDSDNRYSVVDSKIEEVLSA